MGSLVLIHNPPRDSRGRFIPAKGKAKPATRQNAPRKGKQLTKGEAADLSRAMTAFDQLLGIVQQEYPELSADEQRALAGRALTQLMAGKARANPPTRAAVVSRDVHEIRYRHAENGLDYFHTFNRNDVELIAMSDGTLRLRSRKGNPLWENFPEGTR